MKITISLCCGLTLIFGVLKLYSQEQAKSRLSFEAKMEAFNEFPQVQELTKIYE